MTAQIVGVVTREQAGLRKPKNRPSTNINPEDGGACCHWGGTFQRIGGHSRCIAIWLSWQKYHMSPGGLGATNGGNDIAYNFGYCNHGYIFVGRGWGVRSGANGSSFGNQNYHAFVWIGGSGDGAPTRLALDALDWLILEGRRRGAGDRVRPHADFKSTTCAGSFINKHAVSRDNKSIRKPAPPQPEPRLDGKAIIIVRRDAEFHLRRALAGGAADASFNYGKPSDIPVSGDWNGSGRDTIGAVRAGRWLLRNSFSNGDAELDIPYGREGDVPLVGNWTGNGVGLGVRRGQTFYLRNDISPGPADVAFNFGRPDDLAVVGDWNGDGRDTVGIFRDGEFHLVNELRGGDADIAFRFGESGDAPLVGDWDDSGHSLVGVHRGNKFRLRTSLAEGHPDAEFSYGRAGDEPLVVRHP